MTEIISLPDDGSREKEVFASYGVAMYYAQIFERGLINLLLLIELDPEVNTRRDFDSLAVRLDKSTAGSLIQRLRKRITIDSTTEDMLSEALKLRNYFAHSFFHDRAAAFTFDLGKQQMLDFCNEASVHFQKTDLILSTIAKLVQDILGVDESTLIEMEQKLRDDFLKEQDQS